MKKSLLITLVLVLALSSLAMAAREYPARPITDVVVWGAGGGTDTCNRIVAGEMSKILGVNVNVTNKPGGVAGSIGLNYGYNQPHDGYTITGLSESNVTSAVMGGFDKRFNVWYPFIVGGSPDIVSVTPDSPYQTLEDLIAAAKENPGEIRATAAGAGSIHHLNFLALEDGAEIEFNLIPYPGSSPAQNAAMTGEVSVVITSLAEQQQLIRGGKLRPLATLTKDSMELEGVGTIPSGLEIEPSLTDYLPISQAIGMAVPNDVPDDVKAKLTDAFTKALETDTVKDWAEKNYYILSGKTGEEAQEVFAKLESNFSWTLWELGTAEVNPAELGIPKPGAM
ncbi:Tricarboxylate transport protein TctC [Halanaerobium saccharolyticum subsp. saccharolyticum DSM 6643]|uniref:Tricarboxylate transport protein TctC n=1 Tax=Halanaerobium saccharolyticum subsp. saccharolyticum DSM 6643 TaxID=1293054 RepID=M5E1L8_9FIRM|nr:tripartite tricarboxylate transporter substrate binding protein [Halanaerobium saccharolyticum]CCU79833.1 Tricarboxylate transport protein TctC [Halanaerobium saccharolyticum subsp. saccharolyticum DSM 6643]